MIKVVVLMRFDAVLMQFLQSETQTDLYHPQL